MISFGYWLRRRRKALDMTQQELARQAGCSADMLRKIESDLRRPSRQLAERLARLLAVPAAEQPGFLKAARAGLALETGQLVIDSAPLVVAPAAPATPGLPAPPTRLVGRERELSTLGALLRMPETRLVTLTGPGGAGKTHLSLTVAALLQEGFSDGALFVPLAGIHDPALLPSCLARALGVKEEGSRPLLQLLKDALHARRMLLVLDNFEQLLGATPMLGELLAAAPRLTLLVTSRAVLHVRGEKEFMVPPLALPERERELSPEQLAEYGAVRLFIERARDIMPDFELVEQSATAVAEICRRLDGLPLAIELAVARVKLLLPEALLERLGNRLGLLTSGARDLPQRHQTMRATIAWSFDLLSAGEQRLFRQLAIFSGGWTLQAAEAIVQAQVDEGAHSQTGLLDGLASLLDQSLIRQEPGPPDPRFCMLETLREYALERLEEAGEAELMRERHSSYYLGWLEQVEPRLAGAQQQLWVERVEREHDNLRAALSWALQRRHSERALQLAGALWKFWQIHACLSEGRRWLAAALEQGAGLQLVVRAKAQLGMGWLSWMLGDLAQARSSFWESLALARELGDARGAGRALHGVALLEPMPERRIALYEESLAIFRQLDDVAERAWSLLHLGSFLLDQGELARSEVLLEESRGLFEQSGNRWACAMLCINQGRLAREQGRLAPAMALLDQALLDLRELGDKANMTWALAILGELALRQGRPEQAIGYYREGIVCCQATGSSMGFAPCLEGVGQLALSEGRALQAARLWGAAQALRQAISVHHAPLDLPSHQRRLALALAQLGQPGFEQAWSQGAALSLDRAAAEALALLAERPLA